MVLLCRPAYIIKNNILRAELIVHKLPFLEHHFVRVLSSLWIFWRFTALNKTKVYMYLQPIHVRKFSLRFLLYKIHVQSKKHVHSFFCRVPEKLYKIWTCPISFWFILCLIYLYLFIYYPMGRRVGLLNTQVCMTRRSDKIKDVNMPTCCGLRLNDTECKVHERSLIYL